MSNVTPKNDPPDYSVTGESTLGTLVIRGEPLSVGLANHIKPAKATQQCHYTRARI